MALGIRRFVREEVDVKKRFYKILILVTIYCYYI